MLALRCNLAPSSMMPDRGDQALVEDLRTSTARPLRLGACRQKGVTLIEIMVGVVILGILFALAAPSFRNWIQGSQIRTLATSIVDGLQIAKNEAVHRNKPVNFYLTSDLSATCVLTQSGVAAATSWIVSRTDPTNPAACNAAASDTLAPFIIQSHYGAEGAPNTQVVADANSVSFDGLGRANSAIVGNTAMTINVSNPTGGSCDCPAAAAGCGYPAAIAFAASGPMRCMRVVVTTGGQIRMCDPALPAYPNDPQGC